MEIPQLVGGVEGCSSSESGWTVYLASPMQSHTHTEEEEGQTSEEDAGDQDGASGGGEDGDSLESDASSGPPLRLLSNFNEDFTGTPIPCQEPSEEEEYEGDGLRLKYACGESMLSKQKKIDNGDASVRPMEVSGVAAVLESEKIEG